MKAMNKKMLLPSLMLALLLAATGCTNDQPAEPGATEPAFDTAKAITVISREDGSGTRGAFVELVGVEEKGADGTRIDHTVTSAVVAGKTDIVMTNVANDPYAIGYVSMGSLNDTIKALPIDGIAATAENVKDGTYTLSRPFNIATKGQPNERANDFIGFILSKEGQAVVNDNKYIAVDETAPAYGGTKPSGVLKIAGSSSVAPVMEKLKEAYLIVNPNMTIEIQTTDSTAGMTAAMEGSCDIGMASRALKDAEKAELTPQAIALDGIAVIVNVANPLADISKSQIRAIYIGQAKTWNAL